MKCLAQIAENLGRRDHDELVETVVVGMAVERLGDLSGEPLLCDVVPVDLLYRASRRTDTCNGTPRTIGALVARCRIVLLQDLLDFELDLVRGAFVAQKERLLAVADQNECIVGDGRVGSLVIIVASMWANARPAAWLPLRAPRRPRSHLTTAAFPHGWNSGLHCLPRRNQSGGDALSPEGSMRMRRNL